MREKKTARGKDTERERERERRQRAKVMSFGGEERGAKKRREVTREVALPTRHCAGRQGGCMGECEAREGRAGRRTTTQPRFVTLDCV